LTQTATQVKCFQYGFHDDGLLNFGIPAYFLVPGDARMPTNKIPWSDLYHFHRAMHFSAKRGIAIACHLSVCPSVCNVGGLWSHRLEYIRNNFTIS